MNDTDTSIIRIRLTALACVFLLLMGVSAFCTQFIAYRMAYHPALGEPLFSRVYNPFSWLEWFRNFYSYAPETYRAAILIFLAGTFLTLIGCRLYIGIKTRSSRKNEGSHGTAHFATAKEVKASGLLPDRKIGGTGVYCGAYFDEKSGRTLYLRHVGPEHVCAIAPTRSGKGVGLVIPTMLSWTESVVVLDPKGEVYAMTSGWRQKEAGNIVLRFDPAEEFGSCAWNPLDEIRFGTRHQIGDAQNIALMIIDTDGKGLFDHWRTAAHELLVGIIVHALYKAETVGRKPSLQDCAHVLTGVGDFSPEDDGLSDGNRKALEDLFSEMQLVTLDSSQAAQEAQLTIRGAGRRFSETAEKELLSIISTANNALSLYRDPIVGGNTSHSDFKIADLMDHDRPVSLYFVTVFENKDRMKPLARLLLTQILLRLTGRMEFVDGRSRTNHKHKLLLMLDEFPSLGKLEILENALAYIAGYGIKAYLIAQDVQQLYKAYTNYESIISNCHVRVAYAPNKLETAEWLSKMTGETTVIKEQISTSGKRFGMVLESVSRSYQESRRPLMTPDEIQRLPAPLKDNQGNILEPGEMLVFVAGQPVIRGRQILYFIDPTFSARSKIPPVKSSNKTAKTTLGFSVS